MRRAYRWGTRQARCRATSRSPTTRSATSAAGRLTSAGDPALLGHRHGAGRQPDPPHRPPDVLRPRDLSEGGAPGRRRQQRDLRHHRRLWPAHLGRLRRLVGDQQHGLRVGRVRLHDRRQQRPRLSGPRRDGQQHPRRPQRHHRFATRATRPRSTSPARRLDPSQPRLGERSLERLLRHCRRPVRQPDARSALHQRRRARPAPARRQPGDQHRRELRPAARRRPHARAPTPPTRAPTKPADASRTR